MSRALIKSKVLWLCLFVGIGLAGLGWWQRGTVLAWYYVRQLSNAYEENRDACAQRVAALEEKALPRLLEGLHNSDALVCANMQAALELMLKKWGPGDPRCQSTIRKLHEEFEGFSLSGQEKSLLLLTAFLQQDGGKPPAAVTRTIGQMMLAAEKKDELRPVALLLAAELLECPEQEQWIDVSKELAERGLNDPLHGCRASAVRLLLREPIRKDKELLAKVVPLLGDKEPVVRRAALLALASENELVREDALMPLLHDEDIEVQYLCELALRKRGLQDDDIQLARMITDKDAQIRLRVVYRLAQMPDLNLVEWLRQLSQDPCPAVRAAAMAAASKNPSVDFAQRLREMAQQDPSEAIRLNAQFYLSQHVQRRGVGGSPARTKSYVQASRGTPHNE